MVGVQQTKLVPENSYLNDAIFYPKVNIEYI